MKSELSQYHLKNLDKLRDVLSGVKEKGYSLDLGTYFTFGGDSKGTLPLESSFDVCGTSCCGVGFAAMSGIGENHIEKYKQLNNTFNFTSYSYTVLCPMNAIFKDGTRVWDFLFTDDPLNPERNTSIAAMILRISYTLGVFGYVN